MNFFQHQDAAHRNTRLLVLLFCLAVLALIGITTTFVAGLLYFVESNHGRSLAAVQAMDGGVSLMGHIVTWRLVGSIATIVLAVVALGSFYRLMQLRGGGESVAISLGGQPVHPGTRDPEERKLLNVVEEMAIASGTPVPPVYILREESINAFAAGNSLNDAVIGVTRGCIRTLTRDQLQGVIAHEFSHILHGDMKLNLRLLGVLNGILLIGLIGSMVLRGSTYRQAYSIGSRRDKNAAGTALLGLGLVVIGYAGTFFGKLIKAAVSRQREFLADASAVQYTRNPQGIGQALQAIGGSQYGSQLHHPRAEEFSHMYFGEGVHSAFQSLLATHPPLEERIRRILPGWDGRYPGIQSVRGASTISPQASNFAAAEAATSTGIAEGGTDTTAAPDDPLEFIARPSPAHIQQAGRLLGQIPDALNEAAREPFSARAVIYLLLLQSGATGNKQLQHLQDRAHPAVVKILQRLQGEVEQLPLQLRLPLFELTIPAIKSLSPPQWQLFRDNVVSLIRADSKVEIFEWALYHMLLHAMQTTSPVNGRGTIRQLGVPIQYLLSMLCRVDDQPPDIAEAAYSAAMQRLGLANLPLLDSQQLSLPMLDAALNQLQQLKPLQKPALLKAMQACIQQDERITAAEYELFRAIADCLDCPMPPMLEPDLVD